MIAQSGFASSRTALGLVHGECLFIVLWWPERTFLTGVRVSPTLEAATATKNSSSSTHSFAIVDYLVHYAPSSNHPILEHNTMSYWWLRPLRATAKGAGITLGSTVISCGLAIQVEKTANRLFFYAAPHWYANVDYAYGITDEQLASVRHLRGGGAGLTPTANAWNGSSALTRQQSPSSESDALLATNEFSADTKFVNPHDRNETTSAPIAVMVIPLGDIMSSALTG
jgi:hypothetical protein